ncbi:hypothetical protein VN12_26110 [Pirellula sp. SH-Sr6A]|uniref:hypothetical protein n=1 Tax=Pirellula sp. SH-Sr6A TaxID=1632865 RepID=UPI00078BBB6A|nr:hypothetical protein [Pirellula sp. SH-Sr6A]AMV35594.1 hypothetical protein VN12_26110 [Pirellula sp. SH-Sr6A]
MRSANPYSPPREYVTTGSVAQEHLAEYDRISPVAFIVLPLIFGIVGFIGYLVLAFALNTYGIVTQPFLSYGQQAVFISLPICTLLTTSVGLASAFIVAGHRFFAALLFTVTAAAGYAITSSLWNAQIAQYGSDPSEMVLYYPPAGYSAIPGILAISSFILALARAIEREPSPEPMYSQITALPSNSSPLEIVTFLE